MKSILDLNGEWQIKQHGSGLALAGSVPGDVHGALLATGKIPDPYYRDNEAALHWIGDSDWTWSRSFTVDADLISRERQLLCCDGLDTIATIRLNGRLLAKTDNMHRRWQLDVTGKLKEGENHIAVRFGSATAFVRRQRRLHPRPGSEGKTLKRDNCTWIRKEPCNFGWDWGPTIVTCGIWRDIQIVAFDAARLTSLSFGQKHTTKKVVLSVDAAVERVTRGGKLTADIAVTRAKKVVATASVPVKAGRASTDIAIRNPELWWPNGMGSQPLYHVQVDLCRNGTPVDTQQKRIGLRRLDLVRKPDRWGESFAFSCNGKPFFAKGANWIPADAVLSQLTYDDYWRLLTDAADVHMNMIRVWGGGIYEHDMFYDLCDELGVCVWQDFMFACATYPGYDEDFLASIKAEAEDNVERLRHHPCIALWCGNNELEQGMVRDEWSNRRMSWKDYKAIFDKLLPSVTKRLDPQRPYWPCSPHSPQGNREDFNNPRHGDAHLWDVWHGQKPFEWYRTCEHRFNSEFGFQSFPEPRTVQTYTLESDRNITAPIMEWHQRSGIGNTTIMKYMCDWFRIPRDFDSTLWLSQILQSLAMKYAVEHWRRSMPRGMGTLYWQLNDCWPVASWASIDSIGRWKALHYAARHFFAPVLLSASEDAKKGTLDLHVTNDRLAAFRGTVRWWLTTVDGNLLVEDGFGVNVPERRSRKVKRLELDEPIEACGKDNLLVWMELQDKQSVVSRNVAYFSRPKRMDIRDPEIRVTTRKLDSTSYDVTLKAKKPALWAWVQVADRNATYSDNFMHLPPGKPVTVTVVLETPTTRKALEERLVVKSLVDTF